MRTQTLFVLSLSALGLLGGLAPEAHADRGRNPLAGQPAIRHRLELRKLRFEVAPQFLISVNQPYLIGIGGGANLQFHINDWIGVGASFHYTANIAAPLANQIEASLPNQYPPMSDPAFGLRQPSKAQFKDHLIGPNFLGALYATLTPMAGKFTMFNAVAPSYDFYGIAGIAIANLTTPLSSGAGYQAMPNPMDVNLQSSDALTGIRFAGLIGIGVHLFFNNFLALQFELRDYIYKANPGGLDVSTTDAKPGAVLTGNDEYITSNLYFGVGLSIFLPPGAKILDKRPDSPKYVPKSEAAEPAAPPSASPSPSASPAPADSSPAPAAAETPAPAAQAQQAAPSVKEPECTIEADCTSKGKPGKGMMWVCKDNQCATQKKGKKHR